MDVKDYEIRVGRLIFIVMTNILTNEEKRYLRMVSNYLNSYGIELGQIFFYGLHEISGGFDYSDLNVDELTHFENNYLAEVPDGLIPILKKIFNYLNEKELLFSSDVEELDYESIGISIDTKSKDITITHYWSFYTDGDGSSNHWEGNQFPNEIMETLQEISKNDNKPLILRYYGSGDSGYIEGAFDNGESVPADIEDFCYDILERKYGGWEINEGSKGEFIFNLQDRTIDLYHTNIDLINEAKTIFEENFGKKEE